MESKREEKKEHIPPAGQNGAALHGPKPGRGLEKGQEAMSDGTEQDIEESGRARVRSLFVQRLAEAGIKPVRGATTDQHAKTMSRLVERLSYMTGENLATLAETVISQAAHAGKDQCLSEVVIVAMAEGLQRRPFQRWRIVSSWLRSVEGPIALAGGYEVELFRWLRGQASERPPMKTDLRQIVEEAEENRFKVRRILDRQSRGLDDPPDNAWLMGYRRDQAEARQLIDEGEDARRARAEGAAA